MQIALHAKLWKRKFALIPALATLALATPANAQKLPLPSNQDSRAKKVTEDCTDRCGPLFFVRFGAFSVRTGLLED